MPFAVIYFSVIVLSWLAKCTPKPHFFHLKTRPFTEKVDFSTEKSWVFSEKPCFSLEKAMSLCEKLLFPNRRKVGFADEKYVFYSKK